MGRIVDSLKDFYTKQGGTAGDVRGLKSISAVINKISNLSFGGGNSDFVVTYSAGEGGAYTADKTFAEIKAAIEADKNVIATMTGEDGMTVLFPLVEHGTNIVVFSICVATANDNAVVATMLHEEDSQITFNTKTIE